MNEQVVVFGQAEAMVGVLTKPALSTTAPYVIILNAGFVHRVGPGQLAVEIARSLANAGFATLRFDLSGIGDSAPRVPPLDAIPCGIADTQEAMDHLAAAHGARQFVLLGLCSGARHAHHIALADSRVVGMIMLDGPAYPTLRARATRLLDRLADPLALLVAAKRRAIRTLNPKFEPVPRIPDDDGDAFFPREPTRGQMATDLKALAGRKVGLIYIYSGEFLRYRYQGQLRAAFPKVALDSVLTERMLGTADHLYFTRPERTALLAIISSWLQKHFS